MTIIDHAGSRLWFWNLGGYFGIELQSCLGFWSGVVYVDLCHPERWAVAFYNVC